MYKLNPERAKKSDTAGERISVTGKYIGKFTLAENVVSAKGTKGIEFSFRDNDGQTADYLTVWTINANGEEINYGCGILDQILTCLKIRNEIAPATVRAEKYDRNEGKRVPVDVQAFPDLMNKEIGLLLQREEYRANDGTVKGKMTIYSVFESATGFTASEILNKATAPEIMERRLSSLKDRPMQERKATESHSAPASDDFDDTDIPF